ncbi:MAG: DUF2079 domain-containing protein [Elusimicrobia bacterium]|nr:DUF2079 domain-containing protein [Candidatus Obscuribacterium magneticum]
MKPWRILIGISITGLFVAIFPWIFEGKGTVLGVSYSLRSLGNPLSILLILFGFGVLVSPALRARLERWKKLLDGLSPRDVHFLVGLCTFLYAVGVISHKLRAHICLDTHAYDLGLFSNICWNTIRGNWFYSSYLERSFMGVHANWILWPLSLFYKGGGDARVLLAAQAVFIAAAIPFLWLAVKRITGSFTLGGLATLLFICAPAVGHNAANDFHPDSWELPCLMAALWAVETGGKWAWPLGFTLLAFLAKEDVSFVGAGFGLLLFLFYRRRALGLSLFVISIILLVFQVKFFIPHYVEGNADSLLFHRYPLLGNSFEDMLKNLFLKPSVYGWAFFHDPAKFWRLFLMFLPALGLTFLAPVFLIPPLISVLPHILSQSGPQLSLADIYALPLQPFIFIGAAHGLNRIRQQNRFPQIRRNLLGVALIVAGWGIYQSPRYYHSLAKNRMESFEEVKKLIPLDASLVTQQCLFPHFDTRRYIQLFPFGPIFMPYQSDYYLNPEYLLCDRQGNSTPYDEVVLQSSIGQVEANPKYEKLFDKDGFLLFRRRSQEPLRWFKGDS